jgi:energy-coupling factor transporter ATP-binding protein EcfA2
MGQRVMIAIALLNNPKVLIADEPTSALDARLRNQILELLVEQCEAADGDAADQPRSAAGGRHCDRVLVMYQGERSMRCRRAAQRRIPTPARCGPAVRCAHLRPDAADARQNSGLGRRRAMAIVNLIICRSFSGKNGGLRRQLCVEKGKPSA